MLRLKPVLQPILTVLLVCTIIPYLVAQTAGIVAMCYALSSEGIEILKSTAFQKYLSNLDGFVGQVTLLFVLGSFSLGIWSRLTTPRIFAQASIWREVALGLGAGVLNFLITKRFILPWLYSGLPLSSKWPVSNYHSIAQYGELFVSPLASIFFVETFYAATVETIIFIGFMYNRLRSEWSQITSILVSSLVFAFAHNDKALFLNIFAMGVLNFWLYEYRKTIGPSLIHHITYNFLIYGSQLALLQIPGK